jgi:hypothetical protein
LDIERRAVLGCLLAALSAVAGCRHDFAPGDGRAGELGLEAGPGDLVPVRERTRDLVLVRERTRDLGPGGCDEGTCSPTLLSHACLGGAWAFRCSTCPCPGGTCLTDAAGEYCAIDLTAQADTYTVQWEPAGNYGTETSIKLAYFGGAVDTMGYVDFKLGGLTSKWGAVIVDRALLKLYRYDGATLTPVAIDSVVSPWSETTLAFGTTLTIAGAAVSFDLGGGSQSIDVTQLLKACVGAPGGCHGFRITPTKAETQAHVRSREYGTAAERPTLTLKLR